MHERDPGKWNNSPTWPKPCVKAKEDVNGSGLGLERIGKRFSRRWKNKCR